MVMTFGFFQPARQHLRITRFAVLMLFLSAERFVRHRNSVGFQTPCHASRNQKGKYDKQGDCFSSFLMIPVELADIPVQYLSHMLLPLFSVPAIYVSAARSAAEFFL